MLINAGMPAIYWPWAVEHVCFITNRLHCLRTNKTPIIDFIQGLNQPYPDKIDFLHLPRFGCREYKLISPRPGKFNARAEKGWFLGYQKNTSKNFIIYYPHWTPPHGWKWVESFSPHATFNEDTMFGDVSTSADKQTTLSYWANNHLLSSHLPDSEVPSQIPPSSEREHTSPISNWHQLASDDKTTTKSHPIGEYAHPPQAPQPTPEYTLPSSPLTPTGEPTPPSPSLQPRAENILAPQPSQHESNQITDPAHTIISDDPNSIMTRKTNTPSFSNDDFSDDESIYAESEVSKELTITGIQADPSPTLFEQTTDPAEQKIEVSDKIMTGWDPLPQLAGQKRTRSQDPQATQIKRGRHVIRHNYNNLNKG